MKNCRFPQKTRITQAYPRRARTGPFSSTPIQNPHRFSGVPATRPKTPQRVRSCPGPARTATGDPQEIQQHWQHRTVTALTRSGFDDQRPAVAIDQGVEGGRQTPAGPANRMINRLNGLSVVVRHVPLCGSGAPQRPPGSCSSRADAPERPSSRSRSASQRGRPHRP